MKLKKLVNKKVLLIPQFNSEGKLGSLAYDRDGFYSVAGLSFEPDEVTRIARGNPPVIILGN